LALKTDPLISDFKVRLFASASWNWRQLDKASKDISCGLVPSRVRALLDADYRELPMTGQHCIAAAALPPIHKDPFDRMLIGQALSAARVKLIISATRAKIK
jgi:PIN domain nuclease of toxin-antitoxin system|tara:strand:+ start:532 stop:837 length:306 start_codon:yes stop_codon:yes gene_type:complete